MMRLVVVDKHLADHEFLMGKQFSVADGYCFTVLNWADMLKLEISKFANIKTYRTRVGARPKVQEALRAEGLAK